MKNSMKKICCCLGIVFALFIFTGTTSAENKPSVFDLPVFYTNWVTDHKTGVKLLVLSSKPEGESGVVYEWLGSTLNGYAHGVGSVNEYKNDVLSASYKGTFDHSKKQGHFIGTSYGKRLGDNEWDCTDGILNGKATITWENNKIELIVKNNKIISGIGSGTQEDGTTMEMKFANGGIVSAKIVSSKGSYEGGFSKNGMSGTGILKIDNGIIYDGEFLNNKMNGKGKFTFPNGNVYIGDFVENFMTGDGTLYDKNGAIIKQGLWEKNKLVDPANAN
jgi:hypothetical protein